MNLDSISETSDESAGVGDLVQDEVMFYVLAQFLMTPDRKNIAQILQELVAEIKALRESIKKD